MMESKPDQIIASAEFMLKPDIDRHIVERAPMAIIVVNRKGEIVRANEKAENLFGYQVGELLGEAVETLMPEALRKAHEQHREKFHADPRARSMGANIDLKARRKDGTEFDVLIELVPKQTTEGAIVIAYILLKK